MAESGNRTYRNGVKTDSRPRGRVSDPAVVDFDEQRPDTKRHCTEQDRPRHPRLGGGPTAVSRPQIASADPPRLPQIPQHRRGFLPGAANTTPLVRLAHCAATPRSRRVMVRHRRSLVWLREGMRTTSRDRRRVCSTAAHQACNRVARRRTRVPPGPRVRGHRCSRPRRDACRATPRTRSRVREVRRQRAPPPSPGPLIWLSPALLPASSSNTSFCQPRPTVIIAPHLPSAPGNRGPGRRNSMRRRAFARAACQQNSSQPSLTCRVGRTTAGWFQAAVKRAGVQAITSRDLGHTCASPAISAGSMCLRCNGCSGTSRQRSHSTPTPTYSTTI
jgi:hypothetical protein